VTAVDKISLRHTAQLAAEHALDYGFHWSTDTKDDALGPVTTLGVIVPAIDAHGVPMGIAPVHWAVAAWWPGINGMGDQHRLDELREITFSASIVANATHWRLGPAAKRRWARRVAAFHGRFAVLLPSKWEGYYGLAPA
jgi:hypothetical protein